MKETLAGMQHNATQFTRISRQVPDLPHYIPTRLTDYPRSSPSSSLNQSFQSETDSLSTVSESSFTSDSSYTYDANRKPKKKILKNSNAPRKHKRHVRWNLENLENVSDTDSVSVDSSSSLSSNSKSYQRARETANRTVHNWQEFERPLPAGSTGLTPPYKLPQNGTKTVYRTYSGDVYIPRQLTQDNQQHRSLRHIVSADPNHFRQQPQPMLNDPRLFDVQFQQHSPFQQHSTPVTSPETLNRSMDRVINVPVLHLDESQVPQLEISNLKERRQRHLFQFPTQTPVPYDNKLRMRMQTLNEEDKNDYDHLDNDEIKDDQSYSDEDLDEALSIIEQSEHESDDSPDLHEALVPTNSPMPPPIPLKQRKQRLKDPPKDSVDINTEPKLKTPPPPVPPKKFSKLSKIPPVSLISVIPSPQMPDTPQQDGLGEENITNTESVILPPPPEFAGTPKTKSPSENSLHSPSCETLIGNESPPTNGTHTLLEPEIYPENMLNPEMSWMTPTNLKLNDRIVEGAEDPIKRSPTHSESKNFKTGSYTQLSNGIGHLSLSSDPVLQRHNSFSPRILRQNDSNHYKLQRSATLPHKSSQNFTKEEQAVVQWYKNRSTMKPVIVDTDREIDQMLTELETNQNRLEQKPKIPYSPTPGGKKSFGKYQLCYHAQPYSHVLISLVPFQCCNIY